MAFEGLTSRLQNVFSKLRGKGKVSEEDVTAAMREVRLALLEADVNFKVVKDFVSKVKEKAIGKEVMDSFTPGMVIIDIVNKELTELMGGSQAKLAKSNKPPTVIMMAGLQGAGKTTTSVSWPSRFRSRTADRRRCRRYLSSSGDQTARSTRQSDQRTGVLARRQDKPG